MKTLAENRTAQSKASLIKLYVAAVKDKPTYRFDPKRMILDLLPDKALLYQVFMPKREYSIGQSRSDHGNLDMREHRFVNFLKFTDFSMVELALIFAGFEEVMNAVGRFGDHIPANWQYTTDEIFHFLKDATERNMAVNGNSNLSVRELDELYNNSFQREERLQIAS